MPQSRIQQMEQLAQEVTQLTSSPFYTERIKTHTHPVIGEGSLTAELLFVGEAPGRNEALTGRPFIGAAGKVLDKLLASIGLPREEVYITSVLKDRPPKNRDPKPTEIALYGPFLDRQIEIIKPKVIVTLGRFSLEYILRRYGLEDQFSPIGQMHGKVLTAKEGRRIVHILPLYHPAAALYNPRLRTTMEQDMQQIVPFLKKQ